MSEYTNELKYLVCQEILKNNRRPKTIAETYNININTLYSWLTKYKKDPDCFIGKGHRRDHDPKHQILELLKEEEAFLKTVLSHFEKL